MSHSEAARTSPAKVLQKDWPDDDEALLTLSPDGKSQEAENYWCVRDAFEGVQVFGGTGSGKSSGSGQALARAFLESNFGGLVLTAKTDEVLSWRRWAKATNRLNDLIVVEPEAPHRFNFLRYELKRPGAGAGHTESLVQLFCSVLEAAERRQGQGGAGNDAYWQRTLKQLLRNSIDLAVMALDDVDLPSIYRIITSAPRSAAEATSPEWRKESVCWLLLEEAAGRVKDDRKEDLALTRDYWLKEFPGLAEETRSVIVSTFTSMADCFLRGLLRKLFCSDTTFTPEDSFAGKIIVLNLPVKEFNELGQFAQVLFKYIWQRAVERRIPPGTDRKTAEASIRPLFLYADESQFFLSNYDSLFQSTARSSRTCTVYLTQNLPSYHAVLGGSNARAEAEAFLGNLQTKVWHANGDPVTNTWAAESIGKTRQVQFYGGLSEGMKAAGPPGLSQNAGGSLIFEFLVQPQEFTMLRTGGPEADLKVDAIIFQGGRRWNVPGRDKPTTQNFIRHTFPQRYER